MKQLLDSGSETREEEFAITVIEEDKNRRSEDENHRSKEENRRSEAETVDMEPSEAYGSSGGGSLVVQGGISSSVVGSGDSQGWWLVANWW
ncbi:unnamed protein product [Lactuca saligna]|uniref:Uncharacterized protein n=1 Tax=Lactuca saligna TaxID=75948 RepID=A0AA35Y849_LACSI|nr:unnamed protein product [Lactuca saligna]